MIASDRHPPFEQFIATYRRIAEANGLRWDFPVSGTGSISKEARWDIGALTGTPKPPSYHLSSLAMDKPTLAIVNDARIALALSPLEQSAISSGWQDLLKALTVRSLFEKRSGPSHICNGILRTVRSLATAVDRKEPWQLTAEDVSAALGTLDQIGTSSKFKGFAGVLLIVFDDNGLSPFCPVMGSRTGVTRNLKKRTDHIRVDLNERRRADRLPGATEFWEMLRILLEEKPTSFYDMIRFGAVELGVLMGLRVEETSTIPLQPVDIRHYFDVRGQSPVARGGIGHTMFLRHFSEKQGLRSDNSVIYAETSTSVIRMFEDEIQAVVNRIEEITMPLRKRLKSQIETGRIFPEFVCDQFVPLVDIYPRLTGNPFIFDGPRNEELAQRYLTTLDPDVLMEIRADQGRLQIDGAPFLRGFRHYFVRPENRWIPQRNLKTLKDQHPSRTSGSNYRELGVVIAELEEAVRRSIPTKISDTEGFPLEGGRHLPVHECLFLAPKRAIGEGKGHAICDVTQYAFIGRLSSQDISSALSGLGNNKASLFSKYGRPEAANYSLRSHAMRHMHNNELFAAGVADTIITHRFGRKSVAQSHEYDSRTLSQELADMELPAGTEDLLIGPALDAFKLILSNRGSGKMVDQFRHIQKEEGDEAAIAFLAVEADGFQLTPYGLCLNSFVVEPCPRHLECFSGCSHLMRTGLAAETTQLEKLASRYRTVLTSIDHHPGSENAKAKAKAQAKGRLAAIERAITTKSGSHVFPQGEDLSRPFQEVRMTGLIK